MIDCEFILNAHCGIYCSDTPSIKIANAESCAADEAYARKLQMELEMDAR